jgi:hypothetical protein
MYPLPRRERMVDDQHRVIEQTARSAEMQDASSADR